MCAARSTGRHSPKRFGRNRACNRAISRALAEKTPGRFFYFRRALLSGHTRRPIGWDAFGGIGLPVHAGQVATPQKHDAARAVGDVVVVGACGSRRRLGQFSARRRVDDDVMSLLDPKCAAGDGSNNDRKVEFRNQLKRSSSAKLLACRGRKPVARFQPPGAPAIPDVRDRCLRLAFRGFAFRGPAFLVPITASAAVIVTSSRTASASRPGG